VIVDLIHTTTADGVRVDGALFEPAAGVTAGAVDAIVCLPGVGGNFYSSTMLEDITPALREAGSAVLWANTRGHDGMNTAISTGRRKRQGAAFEVVSECTYDVRAWVDYLVSRGYQRIGVFGHSLGAIKAVYAAAHDPHPAVQAVIAASPPRLSYKAFNNSGDSSQFFASISAANESMQQGRPDALIDVTFPYPLVISAAAYIDKYGPAEKYNVLDFAHKLSVRTLFVYGSVELTGGAAFAGMPAALQQIAAEQNAPLQCHVVENADHFYRSCRTELASVMVKWL